MKKNKSSKLFVKICMIVLFLLIAVMILLMILVWQLFKSMFGNKLGVNAEPEAGFVSGEFRQLGYALYRFGGLFYMVL